MPQRKRKSSTTPSTSSTATVDSQDSVPLQDLFKPDDLVWVRMKGYPWWPCRVYDEADANPKVLKKKKKNSILVHFMESDSFYWPKPGEIIPFRDEKFDEYSDKKKKSAEWSKALSFCLAFEKGEFNPLDVPDGSSSEEEKPAPAVGTKRGRNSKTTSEPSPKKKKTETPAKASKPAKSTAPPKSPGKPGRKPKSNASRVPLSKAVIQDIAEKLQSSLSANNIDEIYTLLDILAKIEISNVEILKSVPAALSSLQTLKEHENQAIKDLAIGIFRDYKALVTEQLKNAKKRKKSSTTKASEPKKSESKASPAKSSNSSKTSTKSKTSDTKTKNANDPSTASSKSTKESKESSDASSKPTEATKQVDEEPEHKDSDPNHDANPDTSSTPIVPTPATTEPQPSESEDVEMKDAEASADTDSIIKTDASVEPQASNALDKPETSSAGFDKSEPSASVTQRKVESANSAPDSQEETNKSEQQQASPPSSQPQSPPKENTLLEQEKRLTGHEPESSKTGEQPVVTMELPTTNKSNVANGDAIPDKESTIPETDTDAPAGVPVIDENITTAGVVPPTESNEKDNDQEMPDAPVTAST